MSNNENWTVNTAGGNFNRHIQGSYVQGNSIHQHGSGDNIAGDKVAVDKVMGNKNFTQINKTIEQNFDALFSDFKQFLTDIQTKYPTLNDEAAVTQIIDVEAQLIQAKDRKRWQNFLNLKRLWNGGKKAVIKVGEHYVDESPWGKGAIAFLEGVSEDTK